MLNSIVNDAEKALSALEFRQIEQNVDRYGSREWTWSRSEKAENRYVTLALTESEKGPRLEIWAGADDGRNWARRRVLLLEAESPHALDMLVTDKVGDLVTDAAKTALALRADELTNSYPRLTVDGDGRTHATP